MKRYGKYIIVAVMVAVLCITSITSGINVNAEDATKPVEIISIDYDNMTISLRGEDDTEFYISDSRQKVWEKVHTTGKNGSMVMDISWISDVRSYDLYIKGNSSTKPVKVTIPSVYTGFQVTYDNISGTVAYNGVPSGFDGNIQWRVKGSYVWHDTLDNTQARAALAESLSCYTNTEHATTVYFRLGQNIGRSDILTGSRQSNEVTIILPKKEAIPVVEVDNHSMSATIQGQASYRLKGQERWEHGSSIDLKKTAPKAFYSNDNPLPVDQLIEIRKDATKTEGASASAFIRLNAPAPGDANTNTVAENLSYTGGSRARAAVKTSISFGNRMKVSTATAISVLETNYDNNQIRLGMNGNEMAFYSTDMVNWYAIGNAGGTGNNVYMDTSWLNDSIDNTIYIKGDAASEPDKYQTVVIPKRNTAVKAVFDKSSPPESPKLTVTGKGSAVQIEWRKKNTQEWNKVAATSDDVFIPELEELRTKGARIVVRASAVNASDAGAGILPSNECTVLVPKRPAAPVLRINPSAFTVNTSTVMEYYDTTTSKWNECKKSMSVWDIPAVKKITQATKDTPGADTSVMFRKKATGTNGCSQPVTILFKGQKAAPVIGFLETCDVVYSYETRTVGGLKNMYHTLKFKKATSKQQYQYVVLSKSDTFDETKANWKTVKSATTVTLKSKKAVTGSKIYVRVKGVSPDRNKNTAAELPSVTNTTFEIPAP